MTREEQIRQASIEYTIGTRPMCIGGGAFSKLTDEMNRCKPFEDGAKWADEHPNLTEEEEVGMGGLGMIWQKKHLVDKVCKWLLENTYSHVDDRRLSTLFGSSLEMIESFHKAMEE